MAAPNIVNVANITGKTAAVVVSTSNTDLLANPLSSNKVFKVNTVMVANVNGTSAATVNVSLFKGANEFKLAHAVFVPAGASIVIVSKDSAIYLEENDTIKVVSSNANYLHAVCSYESIQ
jgi:hypothetical protein